MDTSLLDLNAGDSFRWKRGEGSWYTLTGNTMIPEGCCNTLYECIDQTTGDKTWIACENIVEQVRRID